MAFIIKYLVKLMISSQYEYIKLNSPLLRGDEFFPDNENYKKRLISHQIDTVYNIIVSKPTSHQLKRMSYAHSKAKITNIHFEEVLRCINNYLLTLWWLPFKTMIMKKVMNILLDLKPYVVSN